MKIRVSELEGSLLDFWVAKIVGGSDGRDWGILWNPSECVIYDGENEIKYSPSTDWSQGGPIMDRERINTDWLDDGSGQWMASMPPYYGPTRLIAAMRCFVAAKFGEEVEREG